MRKTSLDVKKMVTISALISVAMILSYVESMIPAFVAVPGVKMGLSNIATLFALYTLGWQYAICVSVVRILLSALLFGNIFAMIYSVAGATVALLVMILLKKANSFSTIGVSVAGGVGHNAGQIIAACIIMKTSAISLYFIPLVISGTIAGVLIGIVSGILVERIKKYI